MNRSSGRRRLSPAARGYCFARGGRKSGRKSRRWSRVSIKESSSRKNSGTSSSEGRSGIKVPAGPHFRLPSVAFSSDDVYKVEKIIDRQLIEGGPMFLIKGKATATPKTSESHKRASNIAECKRFLAEKSIGRDHCSPKL